MLLTNLNDSPSKLTKLGLQAVVLWYERNVQYINSFITSGVFYPYQVEESTCHLRNDWLILFLSF